MDLRPEDIEVLWNRTTLKDPVRKLIINLISHTKDLSPEVTQSALRRGRRTRQLFITFA